MRRLLSVVSLLALLVLLLPTTSGLARPRQPRPVRATDVRHVGPDMRRLPLARGTRQEARKAKVKRNKRNKVGEVRPWLALDDALGELYLKDFKLRGKGKHVEVWVARDRDFSSANPGFGSKNLEFPFADCRNDGVRTVVTNKQIKYFIRQFDRNIYRKESRVFSVPPRRNGNGAVFPQLAGLPANT